MSNILVIGGSGFIGHRLVTRLGLSNIIATFHDRPFVGGVHFDIGTMRLADRFLSGQHAITHAILLQGATNIDYCVRAPEETTRINVEGTIRAIDDLFDAGVKPVFVSSDGVFDGSRGPWSESDPPCPILAYGRQKAAVEDYLTRSSSPWITARLSKVVSRFSDPRNILSEWLDAVRRRQYIRCAHDQILSPIDVDDVVDALIFFTRCELNGLFNVCGAQSLSRYDLLQTLLSFANPRIRDMARIQICSLSDFTFLEPRPKNCSMSNLKFVAASGMEIRSIEQICEGLWQNTLYDLDRSVATP